MLIKCCRHRGLLVLLDIVLHSNRRLGSAACCSGDRCGSGARFWEAHVVRGCNNLVHLRLEERRRCTLDLAELVGKCVVLAVFLLILI